MCFCQLFLCWFWQILYFISEKESVVLTGGWLRFLDSGCGEDCPHHDGAHEDRCPHLSREYALLGREKMFKAWLWIPEDRFWSRGNLMKPRTSLTIYKGPEILLSIGCVFMRWKICVLLPAAGWRTQFFHLIFTQPMGSNISGPQY